MNLSRVFSSILIVGLVAFDIRMADADEPAAVRPVLQVPDGFIIELVAGPPLVERPIAAAFDDRGRLYVADSSGSNEPVAVQLEKRPHRIVRLEDHDGDGRYETSTVFADRMMFPEGTMFYGGSLYVAAPPSIWKLTDTNDDGIADERTEWFKGKTLTGCANDLHGPYLGPDGWVYWCKGAFDEQTHTIAGREWKSRASHLFRCRPDGTGLEVAMTGGMDNPVDVAFTPDGERILSATFLVNPSRASERDGLIHAIYGGVYGKDHGVLDGHPRTGELMPVLAHLSAAAPCGLECYQSSAFGEEYRDNIFACQFNLRKVSRHVLRPAGGSFTTEDSDFVMSENIDFHPTDVLEDADGSLLMVDTGGWYKLCCPTSQLYKPDAFGGIYRIRKAGAASLADPRGKKIRFQESAVTQLYGLLADLRPAVRRRATQEFIARRDSPTMRSFLAELWKQADFITPSANVVAGSRAPNSRDKLAASLARLWAIAQVATEDSRPLVRKALRHSHEAVRHAALAAVSLDRDRAAKETLLEILAQDLPANRRLAAEALGRLGDASIVPPLLAAAAKAEDRALEHSITFALIELGNPTTIRAELNEPLPGTLRSALVALDQMPGGGIKPSEVIPLLSSREPILQPTALWLIGRHPEWGGELAQWFREQLATLRDLPDSVPINEDHEALQSLLGTFTSNVTIQDLLATSVMQPSLSLTARGLALSIIERARPEKSPPAWAEALAGVIAEANPSLVPLAVTAARGLAPQETPHAGLNQALLAIADDAHNTTPMRVEALAAYAGGLREMSDAQFDLLVGTLSNETPLTTRSAAADALAQASLSGSQLKRLCDVLQSAGPLEVHRLLAPFQSSTDEAIGLRLLAALKQSSSLTSLRIDVVRERLAKYSSAVQQGIDELQSLVNVDLATQRQRVAELLPQMNTGDPQRGLTVFRSTKAACTACHRLGFVGGNVGPDLSHIGETRTERDLLESILYPSLSFVRSFEPVLIVTGDGQTFNGLVRNETAREVVLATGPNQDTRIRRDEIEEMRPGTVSVMPAGLDKQLSTQDLADLVTFLKSAKRQGFRGQ